MKRADFAMDWNASAGYCMLQFRLRKAKNSSGCLLYWLHCSSGVTSIYDLYCVGWVVKPYSLTRSNIRHNHRCILAFPFSNNNFSKSVVQCALSTWWRIIKIIQCADWFNRTSFPVRFFPVNCYTAALLFSVANGLQLLCCRLRHVC